MRDEKIVNRDCINWSNNDHCAKTKFNYCVKDCKHYRVCGTSPTTPASVASRLTDLRISTLTQFIETRGRFQIAESDTRLFDDIAAVLLDYVRMRRLANAVEAKINYAFYHGELTQHKMQLQSYIAFSRRRRKEM